MSIMETKVSFNLSENSHEINGVNADKAEGGGSIGNQEPENGGTGGGSATSAGKPAKIRKRHRRGSKRNKGRKPRYKWKPYNKLTWEEKRQLEERDTLRAERKREQIIRRGGRPIAPYNTTQFLMEEHDNLDLDEEHSHNGGQLSIDASLSEHDDFDSYPSSSDENFYDKEFTETYDMMHAETLQGLSKDDLIANMMELEDRIEHLQREMRKLTEEKPGDSELQEKILRDNNGLRVVPGSTIVSCEVCKSYVDHLSSCNRAEGLVQELRRQIQELIEENNMLRGKDPLLKIDDTAVG